MMTDLPHKLTPSKKKPMVIEGVDNKNEVREIEGVDAKIEGVESENQGVDN